MSIGPAHSGYEQMVGMVGAAMLECIPEGSGPTLAMNALLNTATYVLGQYDPKTRADEFSRCISFLIAEAFRLGVNLDDLGRYCRQLATDNERSFYAAHD